METFEEAVRVGPAILCREGQQCLGLLKTRRAAREMHPQRLVELVGAVDQGVHPQVESVEAVADLFSSANPRNWPRSATEPILKEHITQTIAYSVDLLKADYRQAISDYDKADQHMAMLADTLSKGIIAQFPHRFTN